MALPTAATTRRLAATTLPHFRGFPTEYWWCWASIGFLLGTMAICIGLFVAACTYLGGERRCTGVGSCTFLTGRCGHTLCIDVPAFVGQARLLHCRCTLQSPCKASGLPLSHPFPHPRPASTAPAVRRVLTPEALQEFELSRKKLITPQPSVTEEAPHVGGAEGCWSLCGARSAAVPNALSSCSMPSVDCAMQAGVGQGLGLGCWLVLSQRIKLHLAGRC